MAVVTYPSVLWQWSKVARIMHLLCCLFFIRASLRFDIHVEAVHIPIGPQRFKWRHFLRKTRSLRLASLPRELHGVTSAQRFLQFVNADIRSMVRELFSAGLAASSRKAYRYLSVLKRYCNYFWSSLICLTLIFLPHNYLFFTWL